MSCARSTTHASLNRLRMTPFITAANGPLCPKSVVRVITPDGLTFDMRFRMCRRLTRPSYPNQDAMTVLAQPENPQRIARIRRFAVDGCPELRRTPCRWLSRTPCRWLSRTPVPNSADGCPELSAELSDGCPEFPPPNSAAMAVPNSGPEFRNAQLLDSSTYRSR